MGCRRLQGRFARLVGLSDPALVGHVTVQRLWLDVTALRTHPDSLQSRRLLQRLFDAVLISPPGKGAEALPVSKPINRTGKVNRMRLVRRRASLVANNDTSPQRTFARKA